MTMLQTPRHKIPYPDLEETPVDIPAVWEARAVKLDKMAWIDSGPLSSRPTSTPTTPGFPRFYVVTDDDNGLRLDWDYGTGWSTVTQKTPVGASIGAVERTIARKTDYTPLTTSRPTFVVIEASISWLYATGVVRPMTNITASVTAPGGGPQIIARQTIGGWYTTSFSGLECSSVGFVVPPGATYKMDMVAANPTQQSQFETMILTQILTIKSREQSL